MASKGYNSSQYEREEANLRRRKINSKLLDQDHYYPESMESSQDYYREGGDEFKDQQGSDEDDDPHGDSEMKESEFTKYVHEAKNELQNQVIKMYVLSVVFTVAMYGLFYWLITDKYSTKESATTPGTQTSS